MAIKVSSWIGLRNEYLVPFTEDPYYVKHNSPQISQDDRANLKKIVKGIDELHELSDFFHDDTLFVRENVVLSAGLIKIIERSKDKNKSKELFEEIHNILKKYWISPNVYRRLGKSFEELGIDPSQDLKRAIEYFNKIYTQEYRNNPSIARCWEIHRPEKDR